jgi:hypothetical protein
VCVLGRGPAGILFPAGGALGQWVESKGKYQVVGDARRQGFSAQHG